MLPRVLTIALNTYRESLRARILIGLAGVAFAVSLYSLVVGSFTLRNAPRVVTDLGAASISIFSVAVAVVIGATSLHRELEQKTIFPILARPITRGEYIAGKFLGTWLTLAVFIAADTGLVLLLGASLGGRSPVLVAGAGLGSIALLVLIAWRWPAARTFGPIPWALSFCALGAWMSAVAPPEQRAVLAASALSLLEVGIITAVATLFSSFSTPFLSALLTIGVFVVGRSADDLARLPVKQFGQTLHDGGAALASVLPNLQVFVPPRTLLTGEAVDVTLSSYLLMASATSIAWTLLLLAASIVIFGFRDFL